MKIDWLILAPFVCTSIVAAACHDSGPPARTSNEAAAEEASESEGGHERFKRELRESTRALEEDMNAAQRETRGAVRRAGSKLGVRRELLGADAGAP